jgi:hypothetical protein
MKNVKSPGSDGFTVDFYKFFWKDIGAFVFWSLYFSYETGHFSQFQTQGVNKGNNKITELRTILQRESQNS